MIYKGVGFIISDISNTWNNVLLSEPEFADKLPCEICNQTARRFDDLYICLDCGHKMKVKDTAPKTKLIPKHEGGAMLVQPVKKKRDDYPELPSAAVIVREDEYAV